jgi:hypothetical protein
VSEQKRIEIFRGADAPELKGGYSDASPMTPWQRAGMDSLIEAGYRGGAEVKYLVDLPGFNLAYVWFKPNYPLLLHGHSADCLYYIVSGSLQLGDETLGPMDSFFVPDSAAYAYTVGPEGVEVLEFRHTGEYDFQNFAKNPAFYEKAVRTVLANRDAWRAAKPPALNA